VKPYPPKPAALKLPLESEFQKPLYEALCRLPQVRVWRQNVGGVQVRDRAGQVRGRFEAGPPTGAADLSGIVAPEGVRLEVEVKVKEPWKDEQQRWKAFCETFGGVYVLVRWDKALDLKANVQRGVRLVLDAIEARRA
jgi:hypothetical protein